MKKAIRYFAAVLLGCAFASGAWAGKLKEPIKYLAPVYRTDGVAASGIDHWVTNNVPDGYTIVTSSLERVTWNEGWYVVTGNVVRLEQGAECKGAVHLVLADGCKLKANGGEDEYDAKGAAICVTGSKNALTIYGGADGSGMLDAQGGEECGAGIGGNNGEEGRNITINGGKVTARGWSDAAGIGGGFENGRDILINGGEVTAYGGSGSAAIGGGTAYNGTNIRINGGIVKAFAGGGWADPLPCGIGSGDGMDGSGDIYIADGLLVKAGTSDPPTDVVAHASPATDITEQLSGKRYVTIEPAPPLPPVASVTIDGVTTFYGDIVSAWNAAKAGTIACPATLKLLKDVTVDTMLAVNIYNSSIVVDLNDKVMKGTMANGSVIYNENAVGALSVVDTSVARTPKYFVRQDDGLWTLTNDVTDLSVTGGVLTGGKASGVMCYSPLALTNVNLVGNAATGGGGAVYGYKDFAAARCVFLGNVAALEGGAVFSRGNYDLSDCQIEGNVAGKAGGGIYSYAHGTLVRTTIIGNRTSTTGGGVEVTLNEGEGCFAAGTKILMADGSEKNVEEIVEGERVATFDHEGGTNSSAAVCLAYAGEGMLPAVTLSFLSGAKLTIVDRHDLLAQTTRKYVTLTTENAADFIGTRFYNYRTASWDELVGVEDAGRRTSFHSVYTTRHVNCVANGLLTVADDNDFVLNVYELDEGLKADAEQLAADVEVYGLFDYAEYPQTAGYEEFYDSLNMQYLYVAIGKGLVTWDYVWELGAETVLEPQESIIGPKLMMSAPRATPDVPTPVALPQDPYLAVGSNVVITGNVSAVGIDNVYLDRSGDAVIAILADAADLDIGVTLSTGAGMFGWTNHVDHASAFTSDDANYGVAYTADNTLELVPFITVVPPTVEQAAAAVYVGETKLIDEPYVVLSNATEVTVVYTAEGDYLFEGGLKVVTNKLDTSKNPATVVGELPVVLEPIKYVVPTYKGTDGNPTNGIAYWTTNKCYNYTKVTSEPTRAGHGWGENGKETWLVVEDSDVVIADYVRCFGHVHLILCDGADLKVTNGIRSDSNALTIYAGPEGTGELTAESKDPAAGIGCGHTGSGNNVTINGGRITATGNDGGAGIGGGCNGSASNIVINAGVVTAVGNGGGAGIGGGCYREGQDITINGGTVTATGSSYAAGIGGGNLNPGMRIVINDGEVIATGGLSAAGIGGGYDFNCGGVGSDLVIRGGKVSATGGDYGAGIGGGQQSAGLRVLISGGEVLAVGGDCGAGIGGGTSAAGTDITISGGMVHAIGGKHASGIGGGYGYDGAGPGRGITISSGTVTAIGGCGGAGIGGGEYSCGSGIAIRGDAKVFVGSALYVGYDGVNSADLIGSGMESEDAAEDVSIAETAQVFFNLTGCYDDNDDEWTEDVSPMPEESEDFVIMTPGTLTENRVLVGGVSTSQPLNPSTFSLTNAENAATGSIEVDGAEITFARTFCSLTNDNGRLTLVIRRPVLTVTQLPDVANNYTIVAETDGNNGITNYAWCMQSETTTGFVALTNALEAVDDELGLSEYGDIEETAISSYYDNDDEVNYIKLYWLPSDNDFGFAGIPRCGKLYFTCASDISGCYEETIGSVSRIGLTDEWVWEAKVADIGIELYALLIAADASFKIDNLRWVADEFVTVAQGPTMTVLPPDVALKGSNYVCRMDYGHEGKFITSESEVFTCWGYPITATPTEVAHTTFEVYTNGVLSTETEPGSWAAWSNETAEVVYVADEGYAFADGSTVKTNKLDTLKNPAVNKTVTEAPFGRFTLKFDVTDEVAGWTLKTNGVAVASLDDLVLTNGDVVVFAFTRDPKFFYETETDCGEWTGDSWSYQVAIGGDETHELKVTSKFGVIKVVYKAEGGAWSDGLTVSNVVTLISGGYAFPEAPVREGSNFIGWFDGATNGAPQVAEAQELLRLEEHALHAKWESVTIDPEGGEDALAGGEASSGRKDETAITGGKKSVTDADGLFVVPDVISNGSDGRYVTEIGKGAFAAANYSFGKIKALITPRYLTRICAGAFYQQRELRSLAIAASVDYNDTEKPVEIVIERQAFAGTALETVLIPSNVVEIADNAFLNCAELAKIVILGDGANLKIGAAAFARCGEASEDGITVYVSPEFLANHPTFAADVAAANPSANVQVTTASPATSAAIGELQVGENGMVALVVSTTVEVPGTLPDVAKIRLMHSTDLSVFGEVTEDVVKTAFADGTVLIEFPKPEGASGYWKIELGK